MTDKPAPKLPERIDGPTPNGGAYSIRYTRPDGSTEIVEFDAQDRAIFRTYSQPLPKENPDG